MAAAPRRVHTSSLGSIEHRPERPQFLPAIELHRFDSTRWKELRSVAVLVKGFVPRAGVYLVGLGRVQLGCPSVEGARRIGLPPLLEGPRLKAALSRPLYKVRILRLIVVRAPLDGEGVGVAVVLDVALYDLVAPQQFGIRPRAHHLDRRLLRSEPRPEELRVRLV